MSNDPGPAAEPALPEGAVIDGRYTLREIIGKGGMATVYRAEEQGLFSREVAIKLMSRAASSTSGAAQRFLNEAQAIVKIKHRNVIELYHAGRTSSGQVYLVTELLQGRTLAEEMAALQARGEVFSWARLAPLVMQMCAALHAAHKRKLIHRDIKPANCFLLVDEADGSEYIKILDFGIAKYGGLPVGSSLDMANPLTQEGTFLGTPHFAAPEVIEPRPDRPIDGRVDMFAVGVTMYFLLTGSLPFPERSVVRVLDRTATERPQSPRERAPEREIRPEVEAIVMKAMAIEPDDRFASMIEMTEAVRAATTTPLPQMEVSRADQVVLRDSRTEPAIALEGEDPTTLMRAVRDQTPAAGDGKRSRVLNVLGPLVMLLGLALVAVLLVIESRGGGESDHKSARAAVGGTRASAVARPEPPANTPESVDPVIVGGRDADNEESSGPGEVGEEPFVAPLVAGTDEARVERVKRIRGQMERASRDTRVAKCLLDHRVTLGTTAYVLTLELIVDSSGRVIAATKRAPPRGAKELPQEAAKCVTNRVRRMHVAPGKDSRLAVDVTLEFS